ncbi:MAG: prolyl-tRNA synthetase associated domain-containing protein [Clostridiales bacterium]|nr:prolyl-tRNA synthetase associated domain-containing protein [Clostridiales bacterium]
MDPKDAIKAVVDYLNGLNIPFTLAEHEAVYTIEEVLALHLPGDECIAKNLFLRNASGKQHYIVVVEHLKQVDLKELREKLGCSRLSFGSEERLLKHVGLLKGSVTPLGVLNDDTCTVEVILDEDLYQYPIIGVHPNTNTATVFLSLPDLEKAIRAHGNPVRKILV